MTASTLEPYVAHLSSANLARQSRKYTQVPLCQSATAFQVKRNGSAHIDNGDNSLPADPRPDKQYRAEPVQDRSTCHGCRCSDGHREWDGKSNEIIWTETLSSFQRAVDSGQEPNPANALRVQTSAIVHLIHRENLAGTPAWGP